MAARALALVVALFAGATSPSWADCTNIAATHGSGALNSGQLIYQSLAPDGGDSSIFLYDLAKGVGAAHENLSARWKTVTRARNPHFSPIDNWILFTAERKSRFGVFAWNPLIDEPIGLTPATSFGVSEDANFTPDGENIVFKNEGDIWVMSLVRKSPISIKGSGAKALTTGGSRDGTYAEASAPVASTDNSEIIFRGGGKSHPEDPAQLYRLTLGPNFSNAVETAIPKASHAYEYYPQLISDGTLFFARHMTGNAHDMIVRRLPGQSEKVLAINTCGVDNSDPAPIDRNHIFFSFFVPGHGVKDGHYELRYATIGDSRVFKLDDRHINNVVAGWVTGADYKP